MSACTECGSSAINPHAHGREPGVDLHLCDVCYWRTRAQKAEEVQSKDCSGDSTCCPQNEGYGCICSVLAAEYRK